MTFLICLIPLIVAAIAYKIMLNNANINSSKSMIILFSVVIVLEILFIISNLVQYGRIPSSAVFALVVAIPFLCNAFKAKQNPETSKPKLYMQNGKVVLLIPNSKINAEASLLGGRTYEFHDYEYTFNEVSITQNEDIITIIGNGTKATLEHSDATKPGIPINRENFQNQTFYYNINELSIYDICISNN